MIGAGPGDKWFIGGRRTRPTLALLHIDPRSIWIGRGSGLPRLRRGNQLDNAFVVRDEHIPGPWTVVHVLGEEDANFAFKMAQLSDILQAPQIFEAFSDLLVRTYEAGTQVPSAGRA